MFSVLLRNLNLALVKGNRVQRIAAREGIRREWAYIQSLSDDERAAYVADQRAQAAREATHRRELTEQEAANRREQDEWFRGVLVRQMAEAKEIAAARALEAEADRTYRDPTSDYYDPWLVMEERLGLRTTSTFEQAVARWANPVCTQNRPTATLPATPLPSANTAAQLSPSCNSSDA